MRTFDITPDGSQIVFDLPPQLSPRSLGSEDVVFPEELIAIMHATISRHMKARLNIQLNAGAEGKSMAIPLQ